ncbi:SDR family oxidoreductase [Bosea sp. SSUT16]|jgi:NAD(P)-dependent dehydrogenase (short-subunit alcohol dehydrogenase family)|uniref:SDR family oxidoreductase n=1 Tax=Bosea spartocytisi TaxID=2773451 RepID=A0A927E9F4_9HYPH|nr:SDR family oxidoreductase [Bosea spartocytisi]MBD3847188.1 SDR family oxidoreductase [Bosea spartocytisi]MCT4474116.1 SDR family oxidoreductase [Bosea spartocytisi]
MDLQLKGKRALVTGGSKGIGRAIARQLALEGADVVIAARNRDELAEAASALAAESGRKVVGHTVDTQHDDSVKALVAHAVEVLGGLDILVNAAGKPGGQAPPPKLAEITDALFWDDVNVKVMGYLRMAREAAPHMAANGWGRIINISGLAARSTGSIIGSMRNVAVAAMTKNLADELGPQGINVTVVHPGVTRTERTAWLVGARAQVSGKSEAEVEAGMTANVTIGRLVDAAEVADIVAFLASPRSVAINGDAIACGGGMRGAIHY